MAWFAQPVYFGHPGPPVSLEVALTQSAGPFHVSHQENASTDRPAGQSYGGVFLIESFFPDDPNICQVDVKLASTVPPTLKEDTPLKSTVLMTY